MFDLLFLKCIYIYIYMHERHFLMMTHTSIWFLLEEGPEMAGPKYVEDDRNNSNKINNNNNMHTTSAFC